MIDSTKPSALLPTIVYKKIKQKKKREYHNNMDVNIYDSYIDKDKDLIYIQFPVEDKKQTLQGLHFHDLTICKILIIHISRNNQDTLRDKKMKKFACLNIKETNLSSIQGNFDIQNLDRLHVIVYNDNMPIPLQFNSITREDKAIALPNEGDGGGVIIEGP